MLNADINIRVRYAETDRMGYVYYGNYATYYEVGRVEALRKLGMSYKEMEDQGIMLPVLSFNINYDDLLTIKTSITEMPNTRIKFEYECYNEKNELLNKGDTTLVFINASSNKPCMAPDWFLEKIKPFFINT
jgi:acyl-CoA thioester hydrolase